MTDYLGYQVLEISPNARETVEDPLQRSFSTLDPRPGKRSVRARSTVPILAKPILWTCQDRAGIVELKDFLHARKGKAVPFWLPSRRRDYLLAQAVGASDPAIVIQAMGYTTLQFPARARHHLAFWTGQGWLLRAVTASVEGSGVETLTLAAPLGQVLPAASLVSQLLLCRLASDEVEISYPTDTSAEVRLTCVELPQEAP